MKNLSSLFIFLLLFSINLNAQNAATYENRRQAIMKEMVDGVCLIYGADRNNNPNSNFYYLTGIVDTNAVLLISPSFSTTSLLFNDEGKWSDAKQIERTEVYPISEFRRRAFGMIAQANKIWISFNDIGRMHDYYYLYNYERGIYNSEHLFYKFRELKDADEQRLLKTAINITATTYNEVFALIKEGMTENEIISIFKEKQKSKGADRSPYIQAGSGMNGTQVHAEPSDKQIKNGELIVFDCSAYYENYTCDISRTVPVNGKFSKPQKEIYSLVLNAQKEAIEKMLPGIYMNEVQETVENALINGLFDLGLLTDKKSQWQKDLYLVHPYYHYIGIDIHDGWAFMAREQGEKKYRTGMVMTMEPGLYFPPHLLDRKPRRASNLSDEEFNAFVEKTRSSFEKYINIGVRIEDDILITEDGNEILSKQVPKEIKEIEKLMKGN